MWFDARTAGFIGGIAGSVIGIYGGVLGTVAGLGARKGKFKKFVLASFVALIILGAVSLCAGIVAFAMRQPYHVWYPFTLLGAILVAVLLPNYLMIRKVYARAEDERRNSFNRKEEE